MAILCTISLLMSEQHSPAGKKEVKKQDLPPFLDPWPVESISAPVASIVARHVYPLY